MLKLPVKKKNTQHSQKNSVRGWLPITDIRGYTALARDGNYLAFLRIVPINISLKSDNEKKRIVSAFHEVLNGLRESVQVFSVGRPIDLDIYIRQLSDRITNEANPVKKHLLREYSRYASGLVSEGEAHERRFFCVLSRNEEASAITAARELASNLQGAGLETHLCNGQEIMDILFCFFNPERAATERISPQGTSLPSVFSNKGV